MISRTAVTHTSLRHNTHHLPHRAKAMPGSRTTEPYNLPRLFPFPFLPLPCPARPFSSCLLLRWPAEKGLRPLRLRSRCPKRNSHQTEQI